MKMALIVGSLASKNDKYSEGYSAKSDIEERHPNAFESRYIVGITNFYHQEGSFKNPPQRLV